MGIIIILGDKSYNIRLDMSKLYIFRNKGRYKEGVNESKEDIKVKVLH